MERESAFTKSYDDWKAYFSALGEPNFRAGQICAWLWKRGVWDADAMTDFGKELRARLAGGVDFSLLEMSGAVKASDGTKKYSVKMRDGAAVETVLLKMDSRLAACVSTQAGCPVRCPFCATGAGGFERSLTAAEIAGQFIAMERAAGKEISSVVFMGMGEPFLNTDATLGAVRILNAPNMRGLGIRRITISTAGIVPGIEALTASGLAVRLAVSIHAANDDLRNELVPCNSSYPLKDLMAALHAYQRTTDNRVTIEYALFKDINDSVADARELVRLLHGLHSYVNLIPGNANPGGYKTSPEQNVLRFQSVLKSAGFESEIRTARGGHINAACGQLKNPQHQDQNLGLRPNPAGSKLPREKRRDVPAHSSKFSFHPAEERKIYEKRSPAKASGTGKKLVPRRGLGALRPDVSAGRPKVSPENLGKKTGRAAHHNKDAKRGRK
ncbi:MAG: 23S rRNA (adenine(2503)-C(2))-methyltransferase RlmN [Synergistaceae bacterium]|jgi:23S rRNA (adenine2503-C2)-methyltransferase|nr:23S rRNA (adenine(2503)-C(2))-methyltransferase RlmN [Synergistaceae bacterium]